MVTKLPRWYFNYRRDAVYLIKLNAKLHTEHSVKRLFQIIIQRQPQMQTRTQLAQPHTRIEAELMKRAFAITQIVLGDDRATGKAGYQAEMLKTAALVIAIATTIRENSDCIAYLLVLFEKIK